MPLSSARSFTLTIFRSTPASSGPGRRTSRSSPRVVDEDEADAEVGIGLEGADLALHADPGERDELELLGLHDADNARDREGHVELHDDVGARDPDAQERELALRAGGELAEAFTPPLAMSKPVEPPAPSSKLDAAAGDGNPFFGAPGSSRCRS